MVSNPKSESNYVFQYQQIFDESPAPKYIFDLETLYFLAVNAAALAQYGYTREEFLSMKVTDIRPEEEHALLKETLTDRQSITFFDFGQWKHRRKNGEVFFVRIYAHPTYINGRRGRFVMAIDIDQQVKTQQALEEKNAEISDILESVTDGFFAMNAKWEVTFMNSEAERMLKSKRDELLGKNIWEHFPDAVGTKFYTEYNRVMNERISTSFEDYYPQLDLWVNVRAYPSHEGLVIYFIDITDQIRIQKKIENDEQNLRAIINNTPDMIWSIDKNYKIISANESFYQRMELITGKRSDKIIHGDFPNETQRKWIEFYERGFHGESFKTIWHEQMKNLDMYEEISINPIVDANGTILGVCCISRDITDNYVYTRKIEEQNAQLRKIAWIQSHEVRGPLSDILGLVSLIQEDIVSADEHPNIIGLISEAANKLDGIITKTVRETYRKEE